MAAEDPAPSGRASSETNPFSRIAEAARRAREGNASRPQSKLSEPEENTAEQHEVGSHTQELHSARKAAVPSPLTVLGNLGKLPRVLHRRYGYMLHPIRTHPLLSLQTFFVKNWRALL